MPYYQNRIIEAARSFQQEMKKPPLRGDFTYNDGPYFYLLM
jgi:hypothetical protein